MRLTDIILKEELGVSKKKLEQVVQQHGSEFLLDMIMSIEDENVLDMLVDALQIN